MSLEFCRLFDALPVVPPCDSNIAYSAAAVRDLPDYMVGKDAGGHACVLISMAEAGRQAPIRLERLVVEFGVRSRIQNGGDVSEGVFTVVRCTASDLTITYYFLSLAEAIVGMLGPRPSNGDIAISINRLAVIFQRLQSASTRSLNGLFGELFLIHESRGPEQAVRAWRVHESSRFDFSIGEGRLDTKTTSGRLRLHTFAYDQCNPPSGTVALVASIFVEHIAGGMLLSTLVDSLERKVQSHPDLALKLRETVASTLGASFDEGMRVCFDMQLARSSLTFYDLRTVPAIRVALPIGVGDVHFQSDLSGLPGISLDNLGGRGMPLASLFPRRF